MGTIIAPQIYPSCPSLDHIIYSLDCDSLLTLPTGKQHIFIIWSNLIQIVMGTNNGLRTGDLLKLKVGDVRYMKVGDTLAIKEGKTGKRNNRPKNGSRIAVDPIRRLKV